MLQFYNNTFSTVINNLILNFCRCVPDIFCCSIFYMFKTGIIHMRAIMQQFHKTARIAQEPDISTLTFCLPQSLIIYYR